MFFKQDENPSIIDLTKINNWSKGRQEEQKTRIYSSIKDI